MNRRKSSSIAILILVAALFVSATATYAGGPPLANEVASSEYPNQPPVAVDDHVKLDLTSADRLWVDVPVLENDFDHDGEKLWVIAIHGVTGGEAELVKGGVVRFYLPTMPSTGTDSRLVGHGYYVITDGNFKAEAEFFIWQAR